MFAQLKGLSSKLPSQCVDNHFFEDKIETSHDWILARTGIKTRYFCGSGEDDLYLASEAAIGALEDAGIAAAEIDLTLVATSTSSQALPSLACRLQGEIALSGLALDINAACSGFLCAVDVAEQYIKSGKCKRVLIVAVDVSSNVLDMTDRNTCILFGDGAGAVVLEATEEPGIMLSHCLSDGRSDLIHTEPYSGKGYLHMNGREVFRHAIARFDEMINHMVSIAGVAVGDVDLFVPHQANKRIIENVAEKHAIPEGKMVSSIEQYGNTMAASIPMALSLAREQGRLRAGQLIFFESLGAGMVWGYALMRMR